MLGLDGSLALIATRHLQRGSGWSLSTLASSNKYCSGLYLQVRARDRHWLCSLCCCWWWWIVDHSAVEEFAVVAEVLPALGGSEMLVAVAVEGAGWFVVVGSDYAAAVVVVVDFYRHGTLMMIFEARQGRNPSWSVMVLGCLSSFFWAGLINTSFLATNTQSVYCFHARSLLFLAALFAGDRTMEEERLEIRSTRFFLFAFSRAM